MPPEGYTSVSLPDSTVAKLSRIIVEGKADSYSEAVEVAVHGYFTGGSARLEDLTDHELASMLASRLGECDEA